MLDKAVGRSEGGSRRGSEITKASEAKLASDVKVQLGMPEADDELVRKMMEFAGNSIT